MFTSDWSGKEVMLPSNKRALRGMSDAPRHGSAEPTMGEDDLERPSAPKAPSVFTGVKPGRPEDGAVAGRRNFPRYWLDGISVLSSSSTDG